MKPEIEVEVALTLNYKLDNLDRLLRKISSHLEIPIAPDTPETRESLIDNLIVAIDIMELRAVSIYNEILKLSVQEKTPGPSKEEHANNDN